MQQSEYLARYIFYGLQNRNQGEDAPAIYHFSSEDFHLVLDRVEERGIGIYGIEVWRNGAFYDVITCEDMATKPSDPSWYRVAYEAFRREDSPFCYTASFHVPEAFLSELPQAEGLSFRPFWRFPGASLAILFMGVFMTALFYYLFHDRPQWSPYPYLVAFVTVYVLLVLLLLFLGLRRIDIDPERGEITVKSPFSRKVLPLVEVKNLLRSVNSYLPWSAYGHIHLRHADYYLHLNDGRLIPLSLRIREMDIMRGYEGSREHRLDRRLFRLAREAGLEVVYFDRDWRYRDKQWLRPELLASMLSCRWGRDEQLAERLECRVVRSRLWNWRYAIVALSLFAGMLTYDGLSTLIKDGWTFSALAEAAFGLFCLYSAVDTYREGAERYTEL
ncbi:MAG: hypothetical protein CSA97_02040 [Bacteroidetes bacterium]|nr:MAG: hypothetical protein CSA97_02040 [Bacteroidota bacterium]